MDFEAFLNGIRSAPQYAGQIVSVRELPARRARFADTAEPLLSPLQQALKGLGVERLYCHQAEAIDHVRRGTNVVIVTGPASGKTLCYNIPVVEALIEDERATALMIYPTKALAQDQLRHLSKFHIPEQGMEFVSGTYDGDTPQDVRRMLRNSAGVILTNPDMLHQGILPQHGRWNRFFSHLRHIVIDEVHAYRGVFGSHLANVIRRLGRICRHYGSSPQFICCSATIGNPQEHAERICGQSVELVSDDGAPCGPKRFVLWNPPLLRAVVPGQPHRWQLGGTRRSSIREAIGLMAALVEQEIQTITFVRTRLYAELVFKGCRERLERISRRLARSVRAYRGGYLPEERREIERRLAGKQILGVSSTNALELGIDIGTLDACILVGYPGTIASLWQQAGRAGRGTDEAVVFLVAQNSAIDQYLMMHSAYIFAQNPEQAVVDPDNPHIAVGHIKCAAHELPLGDAEAEGFGPYADAVLELLEEDEMIKHIEEHWYWASS